METALELVGAAPRSVVVVAGGAITATLMTQMVLRLPGGLSSFGPGKRIEALLKERAAPWGSLFESALLIKALAKRQCSTVRFGSVVVLAHAALAGATQRVYRHVFSDWRVLVDGGLGRGGRDEALDVRVEVLGDGAAPDNVDAAEAQDAAHLRERAAALDDAWWRHGVETHAPHPWWPKPAADSGASTTAPETTAEDEGEPDEKRTRVA